MICRKRRLETWLRQGKGDMLRQSKGDMAAAGQRRYGCGRAKEICCGKAKEICCGREDEGRQCRGSGWRRSGKGRRKDGDPG